MTPLNTLSSSKTPASSKTRASSKTPAASNTSPASDESSSCANRLKVLADGTRLEVMRVLLESPQHVGDLQRRLAIEQSLLSHHLKVLRDAGLVISERDGKAVLYRVDPNVAGVSVRDGAIHLGCCVLSFDD